MSTKTATIPFNEEEQRLLDVYMEFQTQPLSILLEEALLEDIADFLDNVDSEKALEFNRQNSRRYTTQKSIEELYLNQN